MVVFTSGIVDVELVLCCLPLRGWGVWDGLGYSCLTLVGVGSGTLLGPEGSAGIWLAGAARESGVCWWVWLGFWMSLLSSAVACGWWWGVGGVVV
jgi:hypothetical protein